MPIEKLTKDTKRVINGLIYGESGIGKTTLVQTLDQSGYRPLLISCDKGVDTLLRYIQENKRQIDLLRIEDQPDGKLAWEVLQEDIKEIRAKVLTGKAPWDIIFTDGLTDLCAHATNFVLKGSGRSQPTQGEWYDITTRIGNYVKMIRDLPIHSVFTCLVSTEMNDANQAQIQPDLIGKLRGRVPGFLDEVFFMHIREYQEKPGDPRQMIRYLITSVEILPGTGVIKAKDRSKMLKNHEPANLGALFHKMLGKALPGNTEKSKEKKEEKKKSNPPKKAPPKTQSNKPKNNEKI